MAARTASFLKDRIYVSVSLDHFFVDVLNSSRALLVAIIAVGIGLSNAQVGLVLLLYNIGSALSQPFFGIFADRFGPRWPIIGGVSWMVVMYSLAAISGDWAALILLTLAGFGSGAFHPAGTKYASEASRDSRTQATGVFFAAGQTGLFAGPILAGLVLDLFGRPGYLIIPALAGAALAIGFRWSSRRGSYSAVTVDSDHQISDIAAEVGRPTRFWRTSLSLMIIIVATSTVSMATINLGSKLFTELGYAALYIGLISGIYMLGSAVGGIIGGTLGDRHGRRLPILLGVLGAFIPFYLYISASDLARPFLLLLAGFFGGMPHSVLVIAAQSLMPGRRAFASGLTLGLMFFSGAVGTYVLGVIADEVGLALALRNAAFLLFIAATAALILPNRR
jgi:FSR family fosmidomycin resistance protein-like MFS transporter